VATDDDLNARLTYAMTSTAIYDSQGRPLVVDGAVNDVMQTDSAEILDWFQLNSTTGEIILKSSDLEVHFQTSCFEFFFNILFPVHVQLYR